MHAQSYDLVVIGGGPAGICGANTAAIFGKRVALVEKLGKVGGAGINTGTIPSKTLRETALALSGWRSRANSSVLISLSGARRRLKTSCVTRNASSRTIGSAGKSSCAQRQQAKKTPRKKANGATALP
jgi:NAD(P) transhydrogenase